MALTNHKAVRAAGPRQPRVHSRSLVERVGTSRLTCLAVLIDPDDGKPPRTSCRRASKLTSPVPPWLKTGPVRLSTAVTPNWTRSWGETRTRRCTRGSDLTNRAWWYRRQSTRRTCTWCWVTSASFWPSTRRAHWPQPWASGACVTSNWWDKILG